MPALPRAALLLLFAVGACQPAGPSLEAPADAPAALAKSVTAPTRRPAPPAEPVAGSDEELRLAEDLPPTPRLAEGNTLKPLTPDGAIVLELTPDPKDPKKSRPVRVLVQTEVCLRKGPLEVFLCRTGTKEHEAVLRTSADAQFIHTALVAVGAAPGRPVQFVNDNGDEAYKPASGSVIRLQVHYRQNGRLFTRPAQEWVRDVTTQKAMAHEWVFAGSKLISDLDDPKRPPFYLANSGGYVGISNFPESMLDLPIPVSRIGEINFQAETERIPPRLSKVWLILEVKKS